MDQVNEGSTYIVNAAFSDDSTPPVPEVPTTAQYCIADDASGAMVVPWTPLTVTPGQTSIDILTTPAQNTILNAANGSESRTVTVEFTYGSGRQGTGTYSYAVLRLAAITPTPTPPPAPAAPVGPISTLTMLLAVQNAIIDVTTNGQAISVNGKTYTRGDLPALMKAESTLLERYWNETNGDMTGYVQFDRPRYGLGPVPGSEI